MAIIAISGKISSGKDTVGSIIQYLTSLNIHIPYKEWKGSEYEYPNCSSWKVKKFADKLKDIVCLLIGCTREQLEDQEFKNTELGKEWWKYQLDYHWLNDDNIDYITSDYFNSEEELNKRIEEWRMSEQTYTNVGLIKLTPRLLLQLLGTECGRNIIHPNIWVNSLFADYKPNVINQNKVFVGLDYPMSSYPLWCITDLRFPNEMQAIKDRKGITIRVERGKYDPRCTCGLKASEHTVNHGFIKATEHESETALDNAEFDYVIDNSGSIEELIEKVREILVKEKLL